jgi:hypothetical protein
VRGAEHDGVEQARHPDVIGEPAGAADEAVATETDVRGADHGVSRR